MEGFRRVTTEEAFQVPPVPPGILGEVLDAISIELDADSFLGSMAGILNRNGYSTHATKVLRYPSIFCPCVTHETRAVGTWKGQLPKPNSCGTKSTYW